MNTKNDLISLTNNLLETQISDKLLYFVKKMSIDKNERGNQELVVEFAPAVPIKSNDEKEERG